MKTRKPKVEKMIEELCRQDILIRWDREGATVIYYPNEEDMRARIVYKFDTDNIGGLQEMLNDIRDQMYPGNSCERERVFVIVEHGDEYECKDPKCEICKEKKEEENWIIQTYLNKKGEK